MISAIDAGSGTLTATALPTYRTSLKSPLASGGMTGSANNTLGNFGWAPTGEINDQRYSPIMFLAGKSPEGIVPPEKTTLFLSPAMVTVGKALPPSAASIVSASGMASLISKPAMSLAATVSELRSGLSLRLDRFRKIDPLVAATEPKYRNSN